MIWGGRSPRDWSLICNASEKPKSRLAQKAPKGIHLPKIIAAKAMKPRPPVIPQANRFRWPRERNAPPRPASMPLSITQRYLVLKTLMPAESAAAGCSPTALTLSPKGVLKSRTCDRTVTISIR